MVSILKASPPPETTTPHLLRRACESCTSHHITYSLNKYRSGYSFLTFQRPDWSLGLSHIRHVNRFKHDVPSSSSSPSPLTPLAPSFSSHLCYSLLFSLLLCCLGLFMKAALIWGNQYVHYVGWQGAGQRLGAGDAGWWCCGVMCLCAGGRACCSTNPSPLIFPARLCVRKAPLSVLRAWLTGSELVLGLRGRLNVYVCVHVHVCV